MKLSRLIDAAKPVRVTSSPGGSETAGPEITSIHYRSGDVRPGGMFFAIKGQQADGHQYVHDAVRRGAAAVVVDREIPLEASEAAAVVVVKNTRKALAAVSSEFYGNPSEKVTLIGITGTNGKTTTAYLVEHLLAAQGLNTGVISTINYRYQGRVHDNPLTTPESLDLQKILFEMVSAGVTHVVMEVSSHGVALERIYHCRFDVGIFTNLSQDHLDFHHDMESYWSCKKRFFTDYVFSGPKQPQAVAVINTDNDRGRELVQALENLPMIRTGSDAENDVHAVDVRFDQNGINGEIRFPDAGCRFQSSLIGRHNLENILSAAGAGLALKIPSAEIKKGIESFACVPGRLERIPDESGRHVFLDYAHTPDALENVLSALRHAMPGRLICVFGCGGDRDRNKRPQMGKIAVRLSDFVVVTSDNPRTEAPNAIIEEIIGGVRGAAVREYTKASLADGFSEKGYVIEPDREAAIRLGIRLLIPGDTLVIAGKGHEDYQIIGKTTIPFDDQEKAAAALAGSLRK